MTISEKKTYPRTGDTQTVYLKVVFYGHANESDVSSIRIEHLIESDL